MSSYKHRMAEGALRDFPAIKKDYDSYKLMLDAQALAGGGCMYDERVAGGGASGGAAERYLERYNDPVLRKLQALADSIYTAYYELPPAERRVIALRYWQNLDVPDVAHELMFSESNVYRYIRSALSYLYRQILSVQPLLEDWRAGRLK